MTFRSIAMVCGLMTAMLVTTWAQDNKEDYSVAFVKRYIHITTSLGIFMGHDQLQMWRQGDRISIALLKIYGPEELRDASVVHRFLPAIRVAFADLTCVQFEQDRKPAITLFLLASLEKDTQDPALKKEIADLITYVKSQTDVTPTAGQCR